MEGLAALLLLAVGLYFAEQRARAAALPGALNLTPPTLTPTLASYMVGQAPPPPSPPAIPSLPAQTSRVEPPPEALRNGPLAADIRRFTTSTDQLEFTFPAAHVTSWWRSSAHNAAVGGNAVSQHLLGLAKDYVVPASAQMAFVSTAEGFGLVPVVETDHIHVQAFLAPDNPLRTAALSTFVA